MSIEKDPVSASNVSINASTTDSNKPKLLKNFKWWSLLGIAFSLTNSWLGVSTSLVVGLSSGGPVLIIYGLIIAVFFTFMCGYSLCEFAYMLPNSSGSSFWVLKLLEDTNRVGHIEEDEQVKDEQLDEIYLVDDEQKIIDSHRATIKRAFSIGQIRLSLIVGLINYFGAIFTTASVCSSLGYSILGAYSLYHPHYEPKLWHIFVIYECLNVIIGTMNCWGKILPALSQAGLYFSLISYCLTFIVSLACRSFREKPWPSANFMFKGFENTTGWSSTVLSFIVGLINPLWAFAGIDSATHMVEEVGQVTAATLVPKSIMGTIFVGFITSFTYAIGMFYCITDSDSVISSILPIIEIYYQATGNKALAVFLQSCCILTGMFCGIASGTWQSRILWSIGRDYSLIMDNFSNEGERSIVQRFFKQVALVHPHLRVPLSSILISNVFVAIIGCVLIGSTTAFNAIITACICLLLLSYAIPSVILLIRGKKRFYDKIAAESCIPHAKRLKCGIMSYIPNILTVCWTVFCFIFLSFPYELPVSSSNMNYVSAAYGGVAVIVITIAMYAF